MEDQKPPARKTVPAARIENWLHIKRIYVDVSVMLGAIFLGSGLIFAIAFVYGFAENENYLVVKLIHGQFRAIVGLPAAAALTFFVVWAFEVSRGPVEVELFSSVKFKGAAGPVLFWIICFSSIGMVLNLNWTD